MGSFPRAWRLYKPSYSVLMRDREILFLPPLALVAFVGLPAAVAFAGCSAHREDESGFQGASYDEVPRWAAGDRWNYRNAHGLWQNWSVVADESYNGLPAYRVEVALSRPTDFGISLLVRWYDQNTLGFIAEKQDDYWLKCNPPVMQIFPLGNRSYNSTVTTNFGQGGEVSIETVLVGWESMETPAGAFHAAHVDSTTSDGDKSSDWYSPKVGYLVAYYEHEVTYELASWDRASTK